MTPLNISIGKPFTSPAWGSNFVVFSSDEGSPIPEGEVREYLKKACQYARQNQIYLVPDRFIMMNYHCLCLIDPTGKVLGAQQALNHIPENKHYSKGEDLFLTDTEFGRIALLVDIDVYYPEVAKTAANRGAHLLISSQYVSEQEYSNHSVIAGVWNVAQSNHVFSVGSSNVFNCICAPRIIKQYNQGFVVHPTKRLPITAGIKTDLLGQLPAKRHLNRQLYAAHQEELFGG